ncbi:hypothetical protein D3C81_1016640 [compost metagenome]
MLVTVTRLTAIRLSVEHGLRQFAIAEGSVRSAGIDRPLLTQALRNIQVGLQPSVGLAGAGVGRLQGGLDLCVGPRQQAKTCARRTVVGGPRDAGAEQGIGVECSAPAAADHPGVAALCRAETAYLACRQRKTRSRQANAEHGDGDREALLAAIRFLDRDFNIGAAVEPTHVTQGKRSCRHHCRVDQRTVLPNFDLSLAASNPFNGIALAFDLERLLGHDLDAGDLRAGQYRVVEIDLTRLKHRLMAGKGALGVSRQVSGAGHIVLPGLHLTTAYNPVAGIETGFGIG